MFQICFQIIRGGVGSFMRKKEEKILGKVKKNIKI